MTTFPQLRFRVRTLFGRAELEQQLDEELQFPMGGHPPQLHSIKDRHRFASDN